MTMFVIDKMSELLDLPHTKNWDNNLKILLWENFELSLNNQDCVTLNTIITQLQYNLQSPQYTWKTDEIKKSSVEQLKRENFYQLECSIQHAIEILQVLDLYKSK